MKHLKQKTKWPPEATLQYMADGFGNDAKSLAKQLDKFAYRQNDPEVARIYLFNRPLIENERKLTKEYFPNSPDLPDLPVLIENDYYAGLTRLAEYCEKASKLLLAPKPEPQNLMAHQNPRQKPPIALKDFIKKYCDVSEKPDIESKCEMLLRENRRKPRPTIKLPLVTRYQQGKRYLCDCNKLLNKWPDYRITLPTLPPLKETADK